MRFNMKIMKILSNITYKNSDILNILMVCHTYLIFQILILFLIEIYILSLFSVCSGQKPYVALPLFNLFAKSSVYFDQ
jgi:hypothetical protein